MFAKSLLAVACSMAALSVYAVDTANVEKSIELTDGTTLYVFKNGKMGMENKKGRAATMKSGRVMEAKDGQKYIMVGNEVARLDYLLTKANKQQ